jgi:hypothetical protein
MIQHRSSRKIWGVPGLEVFWFDARRRAGSHEATPHRPVAAPVSLCDKPVSDQLLIGLAVVCIKIISAHGFEQKVRHAMRWQNSWFRLVSDVPTRVIA